MTEDEEKEQGRGFKVADRRRFSSEGELKSDQPEEQPAPAPTQQAATEKPAPQVQAPEDPAQVELGHADRGPSAGAQAEASAAYQKAASQSGQPDQYGPQDITFESFILGLSTEALALMGEMPNPATGERMLDLVGAQQIIDIIALLSDKTRGNLSRDEDALLDAILFDLRMKYVEKARDPRR